ncbi:MAG: hypothetical protein QXL86_03985 [Candidatus Aenigmatarchaeota archaeon]
MLTNKAQALTYDFFIALSIFLAVVSLIIVHWYSSSIQMQETVEKNFALRAALASSQAWFKEGYPIYWDSENVVELGMANDGKINETKMGMLSELGYSKVVLLLNLGTYNLRYEIYNKTNDLIFLFPQNSDMSRAKNIYKIERIGILGEQPVKVRTLIWD